MVENLFNEYALVKNMEIGIYKIHRKNVGGN